MFSFTGETLNLVFFKASKYNGHTLDLVENKFMFQPWN